MSRPILRRTLDEWEAFAERRRAVRAAYEARPEVKARQAAYQARPEIKARHAAYHAAYQRRPEVKARQAAKYAELVRLARLAREAGLG